MTTSNDIEVACGRAGPHHGAVEDQPQIGSSASEQGSRPPVGLHLPPHRLTVSLPTAPRTAPRVLGGPGASTTPATLPSHTCKIHFHETMFALSNCSRRFIGCVGSLTPLM